MTRRRASGGVVQVVVAAAVALVVGLALGGMAPRSELRLLRARVEQLEERDCSPGRGVGREIASAFSGRPWQPTPEVEPDDPPPAEDAPEGDAPGGERREGMRLFDVELGEGGDPPTPEEIEEGMDMAKDAMRVRMRQAYASLDETTSPTEDQRDRIDAAIADMNTELRTLAEEFVATMKDAEGEPSRRDAMVFAAETLDTLIAADDRIFESLTPEQLEAAEAEALDPMSYVDPRLIDVFMELDNR